MLFLGALPLGLILLQSAQVVSSTDALTLLSEVGQRYADAKSYHIEALEEETSSSELLRDWRKTFMTAIVMPGGRYCYEGRFFGGAAVLISAGVRQWDYLPERNAYTQVPVLSEEAEKKHVHQQDELAAMNARSIVKREIDRHQTGAPRQRLEIGRVDAGRSYVDGRKECRLLRGAVCRQ